MAAPEKYLRPEAIRQVARLDLRAKFIASQPDKKFAGKQSADRPAVMRQQGRQSTR